MQVERFLEIINSDFYTGVPDSLLKPLCDYLSNTFGSDPTRHIIAANEGNCAAIAAGYHLATGKIPLVYMQNSGEGNIINPAASLLNSRVYAIPELFVIGWRGEPGTKDEPQHIFQGEVTLKLLDDMEISHFTVSDKTTEAELQSAMKKFRMDFSIGKSAAFVIRQNALTYEGKPDYQNEFSLSREQAIKQIAAAAGNSPIISTTGKISRELYALRETADESHSRDFLTVGSMGHASSIALSIALNKPRDKIWCIDGDGAVIMHMGALAVIGSIAPKNLIHIAINNGAHETVGGMPTAAQNSDISQIALSCGYPKALTVKTSDELNAALAEAKAADCLTMIEVKCAVGSRPDLPRPKEKPADNKTAFMQYIDQFSP
ncbi:MAG: phosphonopyruvate decarboxylase [Oscillospiraceae bacterium]|nr:phosphonopyruvate decarboxylase [Oscillospiraceae bacterium]